MPWCIMALRVLLLQPDQSQDHNDHLKSTFTSAAPQRTPSPKLQASTHFPSAAVQISTSGPAPNTGSQSGTGTAFAFAAFSFVSCSSALQKLLSQCGLPCDGLVLFLTQERMSLAVERWAGDVPRDTILRIRNLRCFRGLGQ
jgi:hypothetical protein